MKQNVLGGPKTTSSRKGKAPGSDVPLRARVEPWESSAISVYPGIKSGRAFNSATVREADENSDSSAAASKCGCLGHQVVGGGSRAEIQATGLA